MLQECSLYFKSEKVATSLTFDNVTSEHLTVMLRKLQHFDIEISCSQFEVGRSLCGVFRPRVRG